MIGDLGCENTEDGVGLKGGIIFGTKEPAALKMLCLLLALYVYTTAQAQRYNNLALEGGGIRGIAYAGAFEELEHRHITDSIQRITGTSVGAVAGSLLSVGYNAADIKALLNDLRVQTFNDGRWIFVGGLHRMGRSFGWYRGDALEHWLDARFAARIGHRHLSFLQLHQLAESDARYKDLYVTATNLSQQRLAVFSWQTTPGIEVAIAVRASMSVPLYFAALCLDSSGTKQAMGHGDIYIDGGLVQNYPLNLFDSGSANPHTLGLKLERPEQLAFFKNNDGIAPFPITGFRSYVGALYNLTIETLARKDSIASERPRTIYISTENMNPRVRKITKAQKEKLYQSGLRAARAFFGD